MTRIFESENNGAFYQYEVDALKTINPNLATDQLLIEAVMGLTGEAGECIDIVKKHLFQGHDLNENHLIEELGDVLWYLTEASYALGYSLEDVAEINLQKLDRRYPEGFDSERSINRKD